MNNKSMDETDFVIFDVETTGLSPQYGDRIIELAAVKVRNREIVDEYSTLINPEREISMGAYLVNGISNDMVKDAPLAHQVMENIMSFLDGSILIGHNVKFDLRFLNHELQLIGSKLEESQKALDTVKMSRGLMPQLGKYSLANVARDIGVTEEQEHRAMSDVVMTHKVFKHLCYLAEEKGIYQLDTILNLFGTETLKKQHSTDKRLIIEQAIPSKQKLQMLYCGASSGAMFRDVTPMKIEGTGKETSLIGYCHFRQEERAFKFNRIVTLNSVT